MPGKHLLAVSSEKLNLGFAAHYKELLICLLEASYLDEITSTCIHVDSFWSVARGL